MDGKTTLSGASHACINNSSVKNHSSDEIIGPHLPVANGAPALYIHQDAAAVDLAAVTPLVGETHVVLILVLDKSVSAAGRARNRIGKTRGNA